MRGRDDERREMAQKAAFLVATHDQHGPIGRAAIHLGQIGDRLLEQSGGPCGIDISEPRPADRSRITPGGMKFRAQARGILVAKTGLPLAAAGPDASSRFAATPVLGDWKWPWRVPAASISPDWEVHAQARRRWPNLVEIQDGAEWRSFEKRVEEGVAICR